MSKIVIEPTYAQHDFIALSTAPVDLFIITKYQLSVVNSVITPVIKEVAPEL